MQMSHGAVVVGQRRRVCRAACNRFSGRKGCFEQSLHAEAAAVRAAPRHVVRGSTVYVVRLGAGGEVRESQPCPTCQALLRRVGVKKVVHSTCEGGFTVMKL